MTNLLDATMNAATKDPQTVTTDSRAFERLPDGAKTRPSPLHVDDRGSLVEIFRTAWGIDDHPVEHVYCTTIRPGVVKGWALHEHHEDRYFLLAGDMQVVFYDVRPDSSTHGEVLKITLSARVPRLLTIPTHVWHADVKVGSEEVVLLNLPTKPYDHAAPDKYRLPLDTPLIPHDFGALRGW